MCDSTVHKFTTRTTPRPATYGMADPDAFRKINGLADIRQRITVQYTVVSLINLMYMFSKCSKMKKKKTLFILYIALSDIDVSQIVYVIPDCVNCVTSTVIVFIQKCYLYSVVSKCYCYPKAC